MSVTLGQLATLLGAELHGDASIEVSRVANLETAGSGEISFLPIANIVFGPNSRQCCVLVKAADLSVCQTNALVVKDPYVGFASGSAA